MKTVVLGVTGGIAAYKAIELVSRLRKLDINVEVAMTASAQEFVTPLTFQSMSQNHVITHMFDEPKAFEIAHISLAKKADVFAIVPATANMIGKIAHGIADDWISTSVMATEAKVLIAPAMNTVMYASPMVQENIQKLKGLGMTFISPGAGRLACGDVGEGKLANIDDILAEILTLLDEKRDYDGKKVLVTAGGTEAPLDPVRAITNRSSGKMGIALAKALKDRGAEVTLIHARICEELPQGMTIIEAVTNEAMGKAIDSMYEKMDLVFMAAAVSDFKVKNYETEKIKKDKAIMTVELAEDNDLLMGMGEKKANQILIGFAAESQNLEENALKKLNKKNLDFIAANDISEGKVFGQKETDVTLYGKDEKGISFGPLSKEETAHKILDEVMKSLSQ